LFANNSNNNSSKEEKREEILKNIWRKGGLLDELTFNEVNGELFHIKMWCFVYKCERKATSSQNVSSAIQVCDIFSIRRPAGVLTTAYRTNFNLTSRETT
jgi:hypothetical protein